MVFKIVCESECQIGMFLEAELLNKFTSGQRLSNVAFGGHRIDRPNVRFPFAAGRRHIGRFEAAEHLFDKFAITFGFELDFAANNSESIVFHFDLSFC